MRERVHANGVRTRHFGFDDATVLAAVTTRHGGSSVGPYATLNLGDHVGDDPACVRTNRDRVCVALGLGRLTIADQRHGTTVAVVDESRTGAGHESAADAERRLPSTDALVTATPGVALAVLVADCAPVVLWDPVRRVLAAAHAGRLGAIDDVIAPTIAAMIRGFGTDVRDVLAGVGPCVAAAGYEIGPREVAHARAAMGVSAPLSPTREGHATFDLAGAVVTRLRDAGVAPAHIELAGVDTRSSPDFFSDREARPCGRFALVASIRPA